MKLVSFEAAGRSAVGIYTDKGIVDLTRRLNAPDVQYVLEHIGEARALAGSDADFAAADVQLLPPVTKPQKIMCIGLNYLTHAREAGMEVPQYPTIFVRFPNSIVGQNQAMVHPGVSERYDFEAELAVVIGKRARHVPASAAFDVIAGYSCFNDGSVRDFQRHTSQFTPGKNFYRSGAFGPWIVTADEIPDITAQRIYTRLNGTVMQDGTISDLIFDIPALVAYCSTFTELLPGDVIATGTTSGVGAHRKPPVWLKPGDVVEVEVSGVGILRNTIEAAA